MELGLEAQGCNKLPILLHSLNLSGPKQTAYQANQNAAFQHNVAFREEHDAYYRETKRQFDAIP